MPVAIGAKVTLTVQLDPVASDFPRLVVRPKSTLAPTLVMVSDAASAFLRVTFWAVLVVPTTWLEAHKTTRNSNQRGFFIARWV